MSKSDEIENRVSEKGLDLMDFDSKWGRYRIRLTKNDVKEHSDFLMELMKKSYEDQTK